LGLLEGKLKHTYSSRPTVTNCGSASASAVRTWYSFRPVAKCTIGLASSGSASTDHSVAILHTHTPTDRIALMDKAPLQN
jgi:hypothetical protein